MLHTKHRRHRRAGTNASLAVRIVAGLTAALGFVLPAAAHHSWAMYDTDTIIEVSGVVTRVEWTSPHVFFYMEATDESGETKEWTVEMDPPVLLRRYGLLPDLIAPGTRLTSTGVPAKTGAAVMRAVYLTLDDGTEIRVSSRV
jgi:hypothetical protein